MQQNDPRTEALALWLVEQQQRSTHSIAHRGPTGDLHLHQHNYHAPAPTPIAAPEPEQRQTVRLHPLAMATYVLFLSVAISVPLALLGAMVDALSRPDVQYIQPGGRW